MMILRKLLFLLLTGLMAHTSHSMGNPIDDTRLVDNRPALEWVVEDAFASVSTTSKAGEIIVTSPNLVVALLAEIGYLSTAAINDIDLKAIKGALSAFQKDIGVAQTGLLDKKTWQKLSTVKLSTTRKAQLELELIGDTNQTRLWAQYMLINLGYQPETMGNAVTAKTQRQLALRHFQQHHGMKVTGQLDQKTVETLVDAFKNQQSVEHFTEEKPIAVENPPVVAETPKIKYIAPFIPQYPIKTGDAVFVIEKVDCKNQHEAWLLLYEGKLTHITEQKMWVVINNRYSLWYDNRFEGISNENRLCLRKKRRFCYSTVNFSEFNGQLKSGDKVPFHKDKVMFGHYGQIPFIFNVLKNHCRFSN